MNKLEQAARQSFETWWEREGQEFLYALNTTTDDDIKLVAEVAWKNGAYIENEKCAQVCEDRADGALHAAEFAGRNAVVAAEEATECAAAIRGKGDSV